MSAAHKATVNRLLGGLLIGIAFLVPGISGGALAATLGYFEPAIAALSNLRRNPRKSVAYLLPLAIGGAAGAFLVAVALKHLLDAVESQAVSFFMGMLAGTLPKLWHEGQPNRPKPRHWLFMVMGLAVTCMLLLFNQRMHAKSIDAVSWPIALAGGMIFGAGAVVPGISGSFFLIYLGWYRPLIDVVVALNIPLIICIAAGFVVAVALLVKGANWLFTNCRRDTYSVIIGFVVGSLMLVIPADYLGHYLWLNLLLTFAGFAVGYALGRIRNAEP